jgi:hypothetical protein
MSISPILTEKAAYNPYAMRQNQKQGESASVDYTATSDIVQISERAKQLSQSSPVTTTDASSANFDKNNPPLEAFALPSWFGQYLPDATNLNLELAEEWITFSAKAHEDNYLSNEEQNQMNEYRQPFLKKEQFRHDFNSELLEYSKIINSALTEAMEGNDLTESFDYYTKVILDNVVSNEQIHQDFRANLANSPRAIELMKILGIDEVIAEEFPTNS